MFNTRTIVINGHKGEDKDIMKCLGYEDWQDQTLDRFTYTALRICFIKHLKLSQIEHGITKNINNDIKSCFM